MGNFKEEATKAGAFVGVGAGLGVLEGGWLGVVGFGPTIGFAVPAVAVGAIFGAVGYAGYKFYESITESDSKKKTEKSLHKLIKELSLTAKVLKSTEDIKQHEDLYKITSVLRSELKRWRKKGRWI